MSTRPRLRRLGPVALLTAVLGSGLVLLTSASAGASPSPTSPQPSAISVLPGVLLPGQLSTLGLPAPVPVVGGVVSGVNGLGSAVVSTVNGALAPSGRSSSARPTPTPTQSGPVSTTTTPRRLTHRTATSAPAAAPARHRTTSRPPATRATDRPDGSGAGDRAIRTGLLTPSSGISRGPVSLVGQAAHAVIHPGRAVLTLVAITAVCALGMLALIGSLGRRTRTD